MRESAHTEPVGLDALAEITNRVLGWISPEKSFLDLILREVGLESGDHWLDVGCGRGALLALAAYQEPGAVLFGIDPDDDALELASRRIRGTATPVELRQGVGQKMPFTDDCFDIVTATLMLRKLPFERRRATLRECFRVLKPSGRLLVADWSDEPGGLAAWLYTPVELANKLLGGRPREASLADQIRAAGFDPPEVVRTLWTVGGTICLLSSYKPHSI